MKLGEIRNYIKQRGESSLVDVATHFDISKEAARFALEYWVKKGKVEIQGASCNSACNSCGVADENYKWASNEKVVQWL